jgi:NAD(P)-dependent dehydrogenase (short-subunit alcohol dehydrogenase family)
MSLTRCLAVSFLAVVGLGSPLTHAAEAAGDYVPTVLVTGANRGIGLELVRQYAARGWIVIGTARKPAEATALNELSAGSNGRVAVETLDLLEFASIEALAKKLEGRPIDVLFNNAGVTVANEDQQMFGNMQWNMFDIVYRTNVIGPLKMTEVFLPHLLAGRQKKISNVSSGQGSIGMARTGVPGGGMLYIYRSSKAALNMVMVCLASQLKEKGVAVAIINPGPVDTDMMKEVPKNIPRRPVTAAAADLIRITDQLSVANSGTFWNFDGAVLPW